MNEQKKNGAQNDGEQRAACSILCSLCVCLCVLVNVLSTFSFPYTKSSFVLAPAHSLTCFILAIVLRFLFSATFYPSLSPYIYSISYYDYYNNLCVSMSIEQPFSISCKHCRYLALNRNFLQVNGHEYAYRHKAHTPTQSESKQ